MVSETRDQLTCPGHRESGVAELATIGVNLGPFSCLPDSEPVDSRAKQIDVIQYAPLPGMLGRNDDEL
jgi:hypothetical protein